MMRVSTWLVLLLLVLPACDKSGDAGTEASARAPTRVDQLRDTDWSNAQTFAVNMKLLTSVRAEAAGSEPLRDGFVHALASGVVQPIRADLVEALGKLEGKDFDSDYDTLKLYLLLHDPEHARDNDKWVVDELTRRGAARLSGVPADDLRGIVDGFVAFLGQGHADLGKPNHLAVQRARDALTRVESGGRMYDRVVTTLMEEKIDPAGSDAATNLFYPPVTLSSIFQDRPGVMKALRSRRFQREKKWQLVRGVYTSKGYLAVAARLAEARVRATKEAWVLPAGHKFDAVLARVRQDYDAQYLKEWHDFLLDIEVVPPNSTRAFLDLSSTLLEPEWPLLRVIRVVEDNTQFRRMPDDKLDANTDPIRKRFAPLVAFGVPTPSNTDETALAEYQSQLTELRKKTMAAQSDNPDAPIDREAATKLIDDVNKLLATVTYASVRDVLQPWLLVPVTMEAPSE